MAGIDITPDAQGKVRDLYDLGDRLLLVATDRISAFDYILEDEITYKGQVLTQLSCFWFELLGDVVDNHLISADVADLPEEFQPYADYLRGRFMLVKKADMFPVECIVRGYLAGSGLKEYQREGTVCCIELPEGLVNSAKLPEPIFTPSTKAYIGDHDENISFERCAELIGDDYILHVNPTGKFVICGPHGDTGLTGRKIIVDTYGGSASHGGGCFSGKDPTKVDRSAAYAARWVAKNVVAAGLASRCQVQLAYAIGVARPVSVRVDTFGTGTVADAKLEQAVEKVFDLRPAAIIRDLDLRRPIYRQLAAYGHFGREDLGVTWEKTDRVDALKAAL